MSNFVESGIRGFSRKILVGTFVIGLFGLHSGEASKVEAGVYSIAKRYVGLHEQKHTSKLKRAVGVNPRSTPWCGAFVGAVVKQAGMAVPAGHLRAANWKGAGKAVSLKNARKGDIVVVRTKYGNHVGFYVSQRDGRVQLLGGNQSNQVKVSNYRIRSVQAVRRVGSSAKSGFSLFKSSFLGRKSDK